MTIAAPALPAELRGCWVYGPGPRRPQDREKTRPPIGALLHHGDHMQLLVWGGPDTNCELVELDPLTIAAPLRCPTCEAEFWVWKGEILPRVVYVGGEDNPNRVAVLVTDPEYARLASKMPARRPAFADVDLTAFDDREV